MEIRNFSSYKSSVPVPNLTDIQIKSYEDFLQPNVPFNRRTDLGLEAILRETYPIYSYDKTMALEYLGYELSRPRYSPDECKILGLTYGMPFKILVRLDKPDPVEEWVFLGEVPIMVGGGEFIINGSERVIVSQLHRSPGVDFSVEVHTSDKKLHSCWIIPQRGSWIELSVSKKDILQIKIDQSGKFPATTFIRAMSEDYSTNETLIPSFYNTKKVKIRGLKSSEKDLVGKHSVSEILDFKTGEVLVPSGGLITAETVTVIVEAGIKEVEIIENVDDPLILNTIAEDDTKSHEDALLKIYQRLRPGNPPHLEKAKELFSERFFDATRYRLGRVGRFRINRKYRQEISESVMTLTPDDIVNSVRYIIELRGGRGEVDDIDHLGNRRVRTIAELASDEFRKGFLKLRRTAQERMNLESIQTVTPRALINSKTISSAIDYFFGRGELSQVVDQTNPLSQLTHERRLSALGPGGLNRKRAGFEVRDVHVSHYGRICPIETPEGTNIGLISSLSIYATLDEYGFLVTPYRRVKNGKLTNEILLLRADEEFESCLAPADTIVDEKGKIIGETVLVRALGESAMRSRAEVEYIDISPQQLVGVSASLIPFLEHDDANRALMGSNMQRQAVPLLRAEPPIVATGMEREVARNSGMIVLAHGSGTVTYVDAHKIVISDDDVYPLRKFVGLNEKTCLNQKPIVQKGDKIKKGDIIADGASTSAGELALGRNILVAFMIWDGYNFEDAIIVSERLVKEDLYTSIHINEFEIEIRETKLGREEFTPDIPNVSEKALRNLDEQGIVRTGTKIQPGDILVGKVSPKSKSELTPEEKLLHAIFGRAGEDVKNDSLEVPPGIEGIVIGAQKFSRNIDTSEEQSAKNLMAIRKAEREFVAFFRNEMKKLVTGVKDLATTKITDDEVKQAMKVDPEANAVDLRRQLEALRKLCMENYRKGVGEKLYTTFKYHSDRIDQQENEKNKLVNKLSRGDELPTGVLELVKVFIATKRSLSVGDKMAGRHGNKGVISKILPEEDMPFLKDGTPVEILLNPLGVPSRMNVGQILETHLGWAARKLDFQAVTPVFDGAEEEEIRACLREAGLPDSGKTTLYDGRTGRPFDQEVTVGYLYMMKLHHLVDDKVHARATGPYSLITQQPLGGKARFGGQRFGEMEVWALEAYGAANILQELLTVKSDDVEGRTKIYEAMVKGTNILEPGTPVSFDVLTNEIRGLALNMELHKKKKL
ncbi:MAG: DNA-directed RNA polymerase subunit beta [Planctomycetota bacterium]|jgi:DNA-directed RNA polymerase subunit beta